MKESEPSVELPCEMGEVDRFLSEPQADTIESLRSLEGDILVLGAGGKMGLHLCLLLKSAIAKLGQENQIHAASRFSSLHSVADYEGSGIKTLAGDFRDDAFVASLPDCPTVFYLVGAKFGTADNAAILKAINVELADRLAQRFRHSRIVAFSTGCVYSYTSVESGGSREESETKPIGEYALSCLERECRFQAVSEKYGTSVALIRLNYSVEFRYGVLVDIGQAVLQGKPVDVTVGYVNVIWQNDALNQIARALELAASPAVPINITGADIVSVREIAKQFGLRLARKPTFSGKEANTMWLSDASRSHQLFGRPKIGWKQMVDWIAAWLLQGGPTHGKPTGFEKRDGKF